MLERAASACRSNKEIPGSHLTAVPDMKMTIEAQVESGDMVVTRIVATGTNSGEFDGMPPTRRTVRMTGIRLLGLSTARPQRSERTETVADDVPNRSFTGLIQIGPSTRG